MSVHLTNWHQEALCTWCEKSRECVTTEFGDGFLKAAPLCWACLQKAVKVVLVARETERVSQALESRLK